LQLDDQKNRHREQGQGVKRWLAKFRLPVALLLASWGLEAFFYELSLILQVSELLA